jgi:hypothetical protein
MSYYGQIAKMISRNNVPIEYQMPIGNKTINLNNYIGKMISIKFNGEIFCVNCNKAIKKTYMQGYCYPCFIDSPQTSECILRPHLCKAHLGESRDMEWSKKYCLKDNYVYLSLTSNLKVGVTRYSQIPTRWIDQGAHHAIKFAKTPNRYLAGMIEKELSSKLSDRTQWRKMLQGNYDRNINLLDKKNELAESLSKEYQQYISKNNAISDIKYPLNEQLDKIKSINLDKTPEVIGKLIGIKGQYIILNDNRVCNIRKYTGYILTINFH